MTASRRVERRVIATAMREYRRLRKLGWNRTYFGKGAKRAWDACVALAAYRRKGEK